MKTLIATLAITTSASSASAGIVTFDNLPATYGSTQYQGQRLNVPLDGFTFTSSKMSFDSYYNWFYYNSQNSYLANRSPAYAIGVNGTTAMASGYYHYNPDQTYNISRTDGGLWKFDQAVFTSLWAMGNIRLMGYRNGVQVLDITQGISNTQQTMVSNSSYPGPDDRIDTLKITNTVVNNSIHRHFIMDDMHYTLSVPAPSVLAMIGLAICGLGNRRRKDSNV
jgi:hypothetical protein